MPPSDANSEGYWEHLSFVAINDAILARLGGAWNQPPHFPASWEKSPNLSDLVEAARAIIKTDFGDRALWGWKDPRASLTLPFWQGILPTMRYVIALRNPIDVANSFQRRDGSSLQRWVEHWFTYVTFALRHTAGYARLFVWYEDFFENWERELRRIATFLSLPDLASNVDVHTAVKASINAGIRHHAKSVAHVAQDASLPYQVKALWMVLKASTHDADLTRRCTKRSTLLARSRASTPQFGSSKTVMAMQGRSPRPLHPAPIARSSGECGMKLACSSWNSCGARAFSLITRSSTSAVAVCVEACISCVISKPATTLGWK
jgi:hypothetical protein